MDEEKYTKLKLIKFFAEHNIKQAKTSNGRNTLYKIFGVNNYRELLNNKEYIKYYEPIKNLRQGLDNCIENLTGIDQVQSCLALLNEKKELDEKEEIEILANMIKNKTSNCLYNSWDSKQKAHYNKAFPIIVHWSDFFFSFTNRDLPQTNNDFQQLITHYFSRSYFNRYKSEKNLLAELIVHELNQNNLKAFFDQDNIKCGDDIEDEILQHCKSCYVFIQLIEKIIFSKHFKKNWCYFEFKEFDNWQSKHQKFAKRYHFFLTHNGNRVFPKQIPHEYISWKNKIEQTKYPRIINGLSWLELRDEIDKVAEEILNTKRKILKRYLGDFF